VRATPSVVLMAVSWKLRSAVPDAAMALESTNTAQSESVSFSASLIMSFRSRAVAFQLIFL